MSMVMDVVPMIDHKTPKGPSAFRFRIASIGCDKIGEHFYAGHQRQDAGVTPEGESKILRSKGLQIQAGQLKSELPDRADHHRPQQDQHSGCCRTEHACGGLRPRDSPASR